MCPLDPLCPFLRVPSLVLSLIYNLICGHWHLSLQSDILAPMSTLSQLSPSNLRVPHIHYSLFILTSSLLHPVTPQQLSNLSVGHTQASESSAYQVRAGGDSTVPDHCSDLFLLPYPLISPTLG